MRKKYYTLFVMILVSALFTTAVTYVLNRDHIYAKQATSQTMTPLRQPALRSNNAGSFQVTGGVSGVDWTYTGNTLSIIKSGTYKVTGDGQQTSENIRVDNNFHGTITIENVNILSSSADPINIGNATVDLVLRGENTLSSGGTLGMPSGGGLIVGANGKLTINGDGKLLAVGSLGAGIDGAENTAFGSITINSGTINIQQTWTAAGIGGGYNAECGDITINGGNITIDVPEQNIGASGAGIGSGLDATSNSTITINGGVISSVSRQWGAAIGSGFNVKGKTDVIVNGGNIIANSNFQGAAIGSAGIGQAERPGASVTIHGGTITANGEQANAIGVGGGLNGVVGDPCPIVITGGSVKANKMSAATDGKGHTVYLAEVMIGRALDALRVDGNAFNRTGAHPLKDAASSRDENFYLYLPPGDHAITNNNWKATAKWDDDSKTFTVGSLSSNPAYTTVSYENINSIPDPNNPTNPDWEVLVPSSIAFKDQAKKVGVDVRIETVNGGSMPGYAVDVFVKSKNGYKLILDSDKVEYDLQYRQKDGEPWQSMKQNGKQSGKLGTFGADSKSGDTIKGVAVLSGTATQTGKYVDTLTYTLQQP